jgi:hypothetical protein
MNRHFCPNLWTNLKKIRGNQQRASRTSAMNELEQKFVSLQREYQIILNERNQLKGKKQFNRIRIGFIENFLFLDQVASYADQLQSTHSQLNELEKQRSLTEIESKQVRSRLSFTLKACSSFLLTAKFQV